MLRLILCLTKKRRLIGLTTFTWTQDPRLFACKQISWENERTSGRFEPSAKNIKEWADELGIDAQRFFILLDSGFLGLKVMQAFHGNQAVHQ